MSLDNPTKTNWDSSDGVQFTDINNIEENIQALEDSKHEDGDSPTYVTENVTTSNIDTANIDTLNPTNVTSGSQLITSGSTWTPSIGFYVISGSSSIVIEVNTHTSTSRGCFFTNGSAIRVKNNGGGSETVFYIKMG